jgi:hypothetical protein
MNINLLPNSVECYRETEDDCPDCYGSGVWDTGEEILPCPTCGGDKTVVSIY